ncbi:hypothetical protein [Streptomyces longispororuber]|uniref:hypothetical protein n=1 Tax=Streptomyces longispororuber TaxID=68230 RepID=UPI003702CCF1
MRKTIGACVAAVAMAGSLSVAGQASAQDADAPARSTVRTATTTVSADAKLDAELQRLRCGGTIKRLSNGPGIFGNKRWDIYFKNCSNRTVERKVDIKRSRDLECKKIKARKTVKWHYETGHFGPDSPRKVKKC